MHLCRSSSNVPRLPSFLEMLQNLHVLLTFEKVHNPLRLPRGTTSELPKKWSEPLLFLTFWLRMCFAPQRGAIFQHLNFQKWSGLVVLCTFWLRNVLRATTGCTFSDISTSKSGPRMVCFVHFDFDMCFAPQRRALFRHLNFQKCSEREVLCTFWVRNVLRATTACTFSTSQLPKVLRTWGALHILSSKRASRYNCVHFFDISTSKSAPNVRCFAHFEFETCFALQLRALFRHLNFQNCSEREVFSVFSFFTCKCASRHNGLHLPAALASLLFDPPEPQIIGKTQCFGTFPPFRASASSFFLLFFLPIFLFSLPLPCSAFHLSILSEVWLLNFLRQCGAL